MKNFLLKLFRSCRDVCGQITKAAHLLSLKSPKEITQVAFQRNAYASNFRKRFLRKKFTLMPVLFLIVITRLNAQITDTTTFPLNNYLYTTTANPYPLVNSSALNAIDTTKLVNVMNYGAKGDGKTFDDAAIASAFKAAQYGVRFPSGKTFLVSKLTDLILSRDMIVYAYGATIKMADFCRYSFLSLEYQKGSYHNSVIWLGGTFDGNKDKQSWPGSPSGQTAWAESHGRFVGVSYADFALFKDVTLTNIVMDGIGLESNRIGVISDCKASGGAPFKWSEVGQQGTYFKCTRAEAQAFYCNNLSCTGGSIGIQYSTKNGTVSDKSVSVLNNCYFLNQRQNPAHFEDCRKVFLYKCTTERNSTDFSEGFHLSNQTIIASVKSCQFKNAHLDFVNASSLKLGIVDSSQFTSQSGLKPVTFIEGRATICVNSSFAGTTTSGYQAELRNTRNCAFTDFGSLAISGGYATDGCAFTNGTTPVQTARNGFVMNCTYTNVTKSDYKGITSDQTWQKVFSSAIRIVDDKNNYIGLINCNAVINSLAEKTSNNSSNSSAALINKNGGNLKNQKISVYPNPTVNVLNLTLDEKITGKVVLNIYDQQARLLHTETIYKNTSVLLKSIDVKTFNAGFYVLQIVNEHEKISQNFIVAK